MSSPTAHAVRQPGQLTVRFMASPPSASLKVKKRGLLHFGQLKFSPPTVIEPLDAHERLKDAPPCARSHALPRSAVGRFMKGLRLPQHVHARREGRRPTARQQRVPRDGREEQAGRDRGPGPGGEGTPRYREGAGRGGRLCAEHPWSCRWDGGRWVFST